MVCGQPSVLLGRGVIFSALGKPSVLLGRCLNFPAGGSFKEEKLGSVMARVRGEEVGKEEEDGPRGTVDVEVGENWRAAVAQGRRNGGLSMLGMRSRRCTRVERGLFLFNCSVLQSGEVGPRLGGWLVRGWRCDGQERNLQ